MVRNQTRKYKGYDLIFSQKIEIIPGMKKNPENPGKKPRGGRRKGAGRPIANPEGPVRKLDISVPPALADELDALWGDGKRWAKRSEVVTEAIRRLIKSEARRRK